MQELKNIDTYVEYKNTLKQELNSAAVSFVKIGYLLKQARDTDILRDSGYITMEEFAREEFQLEKSQVSRFININDRFSVGGNSEILEEKYQGYGVAKLGIMLTLSDEVVEHLSPKLSKQQINKVQREIKSEQEIGGIELILEGTNPEQDKYKEIISKCIFEYYHVHPHEYVKMYNIQEWDREKVIQIFCPAGVMAETVRIQGVGRYMISVKNLQDNVIFINVRDNTTEECSWEYLIDTIFNVCMCNARVAGKSLKPEEAWENIYKEEYPELLKSEKTKSEQDKQEVFKNSTIKSREQSVVPVQSERQSKRVREQSDREEEYSAAVIQQSQVIENIPQETEILLESTEVLEQKKKIINALDEIKSEIKKSYHEIALKMSKETTVLIEQLIKLESKDENEETLK